MPCYPLQSIAPLGLECKICKYVPWSEIVMCENGTCITSMRPSEVDMILGRFSSSTGSWFGQWLHLEYGRTFSWFQISTLAVMRHETVRVVLSWIDCMLREHRCGIQMYIRMRTLNASESVLQYHAWFLKASTITYLMTSVLILVNRVLLCVAIWVSVLQRSSMFAQQLAKDHGLATITLNICKPITTFWKLCL